MASAKATGSPVVTDNAEQVVVKEEEMVEYRDQDGNLLDEAEVAALDSDVEYSTHYETRVKVVDADGNFLREEGPDEEAIAPPHPDVDGRNPETSGDQATADAQPATADVGDDLEKEQNVEQGQDQVGEAKPASEGQPATKK